MSDEEGWCTVRICDGCNESRLYSPNLLHNTLVLVITSAKELALQRICFIGGSTVSGVTGSLVRSKKSIPLGSNAFISFDISQT
jgi:hypothetical protein